MLSVCPDDGRTKQTLFERHRCALLRTGKLHMEADKADSVKAVYELREAAVEHGKAVANLDADPTPAARNDVLDTKLVLEQKTVAALDECSESAEEAVAESKREAR
jgi:hypothetical protein